MSYDAHFRVFRGDGDTGELVDYQVEVNEGEVVLDIIHRLQATQAADLAVRWNCKAGKCGSCSAEINGRPRLMCMTRLSDFDPTETITVTQAGPHHHPQPRPARRRRPPRRLPDRPRPAVARDGRRAPERRASFGCTAGCVRRADVAEVSFVPPRPTRGRRRRPRSRRTSCRR